MKAKAALACSPVTSLAPRSFATFRRSINIAFSHPFELDPTAS
ncbi:hypothetical protein [Sphingobium sp. YR768]